MCALKCASSTDPCQFEEKKIAFARNGVGFIVNLLFEYVYAITKRKKKIDGADYRYMVWYGLLCTMCGFRLQFTAFAFYYIFSKALSSFPPYLLSAELAT